VRAGRVSVDGEVIASIQRGLVLLVGVGHGDGQAEAEWMAAKCAGLRVFEDEAGKINRSVLEVGGQALLVSQFTLYADVRKGRRPSFTQAAEPGQAEALVEAFAEALRSEGVPTQTGRFAAHMVVEIENDGPVTIMLERSARS
jgi:D-tyrosyl-tRNA(Tyr) deacylase